MVSPKQLYLREELPDLDEYADLPIGALIHCTELEKPRIYIRKTKSYPHKISDWYYIEVEKDQKAINKSER